MIDPGVPTAVRCEGVVAANHAVSSGLLQLDLARMRRRRVRFRRRGLVVHGDTVAREDERVAAALVVEIQHARIDLDETAVEALQHVARRRRRMTDDEALGAVVLRNYGATPVRLPQQNAAWQTVLAALDQDEAAWDDLDEN